MYACRYHTYLLHTIPYIARIGCAPSMYVLRRTRAQLTTCSYDRLLFDSIPMLYTFLRVASYLYNPQRMLFLKKHFLELKNKFNPYQIIGGHCIRNVVHVPYHNILCVSRKLIINHCFIFFGNISHEEMYCIYS